MEGGLCSIEFLHRRLERERCRCSWWHAKESSY